MKVLFLAVQATGNAARRQPLEEQPYLYQIAWLEASFNDEANTITFDPEALHSVYIRPKAELHPRVQQILKISRDTLDDEPSFEQILPQVADVLNSVDLIIAHDWMKIQGLLENERLRDNKKFPSGLIGQSLRMLTKDRAQMKTKRNKRLRSPTLKELHTKLFGAKRVELYTADGLVRAQLEVFKGLIEKEIITRDITSQKFVSTHRPEGVYYRGR